jgi:hypothetical protein
MRTIVPNRSARMLSIERKIAEIQRKIFMSDLKRMGYNLKRIERIFKEIGYNLRKEGN